MTFNPESVQVPDFPISIDETLQRHRAFGVLTKSTTDDVFEVAVAAQEHEYRQLVRTPVATSTEILSKARILMARQVENHAHLDPHPSDREDFHMLASIVADLERLASAPSPRR